MRRIDRANAGFSRKVSGIRDWANCVVADAVQVEPVSTLNSLLTGKLTGNFVKIASLMRFCTLTREQIQRFAAKFPTQQNREFLRRNREFERAIEQSDFRMIFSEGTATIAIIHPNATCCFNLRLGDHLDQDARNVGWSDPSSTENSTGIISSL